MSLRGTHSGPVSIGKRLVFGLMFFLAGLAVAYTGFMNSLEASKDGVVLILFGLVFMLAGISIFYWSGDKTI